jgi:hypothetical protein
MARSPSGAPWMIWHNGQSFSCDLVDFYNRTADYFDEMFRQTFSPERLPTIRLKTYEMAACRTLYPPYLSNQSLLCERPPFLMTGVLTDLVVSAPLINPAGVITRDEWIAFSIRIQRAVVLDPWPY